MLVTYLKTTVAIAITTCFTAGSLNGQLNLSLTEAVRGTLDQHPELRIQQEQVRFNVGAKQRASASFDTLLSTGLGHNRLNNPLTAGDRRDLAESGFNIGNQATSLTDLSSGASRLLRNGMSVSADIGSTQTFDNLFNGGVNRSATNVALTVPLMANAGRYIVTANERAAETTIGASELDVTQVASELILNTLRSYWRAVAAKRALEVALGSEERGRQFVVKIQALIDADKSPRSDLQNVTANLSQRTATRIAAEQRLIAAQQQLAIDMGFTTSAMMLRLPDPSSEFPTDTPESFLFDDRLMRAYIEEALRNRADIRSARMLVDAASTRHDASRNLFRPQLDLTFSVGYSGLREGKAPNQYLSSLILGGRGMDVRTGITYTVPRNRLQARGQTLQASAELTKAQIRVRDLERTAAAEVVLSLNAVRNSLLGLRSAVTSVAAYERALDGERERLRLGLGSIVETLTIEDRLTGALSQLVEAQLAYPLAVAQLRYATGSFFDVGRPIDITDESVLTTVPSISVRNPAVLPNN